MYQCFRDKIDMAVRLFTALKLEDPSLRLTIQEAATSLATAYKVISYLYGVSHRAYVLLLISCSCNLSFVGEYA